jgi:CubicO group peptidase (beta-lactamase class C family)
LVATPVHPAEAQRAWPAVTRRFHALAQAAHVVGGSAVLVRDRRIVARHHYGFADRTVGRGVNDSTLYHWAWVIKTLIGIAGLQLRLVAMLPYQRRSSRPAHAPATPIPAASNGRPSSR